MLYDPREDCSHIFTPGYVPCLAQLLCHYCDNEMVIERKARLQAGMGPLYTGEMLWAFIQCAVVLVG